ncbi:transmembrane protein 119b [Hypanus sabinus]|uniref:transmembrane protein 119b n=1 Tax=Hypanus sabinus TaxID=79690 RepID=UPI0028C4CE5D|nr:transmembrane protein 119b [Hypanus sabinus]XP_059843917.1 transmembrane protein 119b [Hypanus sabinus]
MAIWLMLLQLVPAIMGRYTTKSISNYTNITAMSSVEASGISETEVTNASVPYFTSEVSTDVDITSVSYTSSPAITSSKPPLIGTIIMEFILKHMVFIIIAAVALVLLLIIVCTIIFMKLSKGSAYYPSSFPTKKYVDEQDKRGSSKNFEEVTGMISGEPKEDTVNSTEQLQSDILSVNHNLKKKAPSKGEEKQEVDASGKGEPNQAVGKETGPEVGTNVEGQMSDSNTAREPEKDWNERTTEQEDKKGGTEGAEKGKRGNEEEDGKDKMELETGVALGHSLQQPSNQTADKPHVDADTASDKVGEVGGQEPKEVKFAEQGVSESSSVADHCKDLEATPLILKPSDNGAL